MWLKRVLFLLICVGMAVCAYSYDVYVYVTGNYTPLKVAKNISSIAFGQNTVTIKGTDGTSSELSYDAFNYFRFYPTPVPAGIKKVSRNEAAIGYDGKNVTVRLQGRIDVVELVDTSGHTINKYSPGTEAFSFDIANKAAGIYIVKVVAGEKNYIKKIVAR
jgi:hypothetical protein